MALDLVSFWKSTRSGLQGGGSGRLEPKSAGFHPKNHLPPPQNSPIQTPTTHRCLWMRALKAKPSLQLVVKFWMFTSGYLRQGLGFGEGVSRPPP